VGGQAGKVPADVDVSVPNVARMYDYLLGGGRNFAADRELAERAAALVPGLQELAWLNRSFLRRAVLFLVSQGIRQFLDLGSGVPTVGNVHEVANRTDRSSRVMYVDCDPVAVAHTERLLTGNDRASILHADLRDRDAVLGARATRRLLDFDRPVGLLMVSVLHWLPDEHQPGEIVAAYRDALPAGSFLAVSHLTADFRPEQITAGADLVADAGAERMHPRSRQEVTRLLRGLELVAPGVVSTPHWRPDLAPDLGATNEPGDCLAAVARKR
jgi:hypothetical protein